MVNKLKIWFSGIWLKFKIAWNKFINKLKFGLIATAVATTGVAAGTEIGRPDCDYIIYRNEQEICLTEEQILAIYQKLSIYKAGFGEVSFDGGIKVFDEQK